jgi:hypothetical protein
MISSFFSSLVCACALRGAQAFSIVGVAVFNRLNKVSANLSKIALYIF